MSDEKRSADRLTPGGLPPVTAESHDRAVEAMKPYIKDFQKAADEQTASDLGTDTMRTLLEASRRDHTVICPAHTYHVEAQDGGPCNCGADAWNARVDAVLSKS